MLKRIIGAFMVECQRVCDDNPSGPIRLGRAIQPPPVSERWRTVYSRIHTNVSHLLFVFFFFSPLYHIVYFTVFSVSVSVGN